MNVLDAAYTGPSVFDGCGASESILMSPRQMLLRPRVANSKFIKNEITWGAIEISDDSTLVIKNPMNQYTTADFETARGTGFWIPVNYAGRYDGGAYNDVLSLSAESGTYLPSVQIREIEALTDDKTRTDAFESIFGISAGWNLGLSCAAGENLADKAEADKRNYRGGFLFPEVQSITELQVSSGDESSYFALQPGASTTVTVKFQYYLDETGTSEVSKRLFFDIRPTLTEQCEHYILEVKAKYAAFYTGSTQQEKYTPRAK